jgi:hypothetical protein
LYQTDHSIAKNGNLYYNIHIKRNEQMPIQDAPRDDFQIQHEAVTDMMHQGVPISRNELLREVRSLEGLGTSMVGSDKLSMWSFANTMHQVFHKVGEVEVIPPFTKAQENGFAGKIATYGAIVESAQASNIQAAAAEPKPTPTEALAASGAKRAK